MILDGVVYSTDLKNCKQTNIVTGQEREIKRLIGDDLCIFRATDKLNESYPELSIPSRLLTLTDHRYRGGSSENLYVPMMRRLPFPRKSFMSFVSGVVRYIDYGEQLINPQDMNLSSIIIGEDLSYNYQINRPRIPGGVSVFSIQRDSMPFPLAQRGDILEYSTLESLEQIGEGSFSVVYKGIYKQHTVAVKRLRTEDQSWGIL